MLFNLDSQAKYDLQDDGDNNCQRKKIKLTRHVYFHTLNVDRDLTGGKEYG